jgi:hypothetical protein
MKPRKIFFFLLIIVIQYSILTYFLINLELNTDFSSFYWATKHYVLGLDPYLKLDSSLFQMPHQMAINLNPPSFIQSIASFAQLEYPHALYLWTALGFFAGIIGAVLSFYIISTPIHFKKEWPIFLLIHLGMFSTVISYDAGQVSGFLLLFLMAGYFFFMRKQDGWAGVLWGYIGAIKLFPALLLFFALSQRRYKLVGVMIATFLIVTLAPALLFSPSIYVNYFKVLSKVYWYPANWNASIYGELTRLFSAASIAGPGSIIKAVYALLFLAGLVWYIRTLSGWRDNESNQHLPFCFSLAMMLLLSPFGWQYYFSLLLLPLTLIFNRFREQGGVSLNELLLWALCVLFINLPSALALPSKSMMLKVSYCSVYFYGLLICIYLLFHIRKSGHTLPRRIYAIEDSLIKPVEVSLIISTLVTFGVTLYHFSSDAPAI